MPGLDLADDGQFPRDIAAWRHEGFEYQSSDRHLVRGRPATDMGPANNVIESFVAQHESLAGVERLLPLAAAIPLLAPRLEQVSIIGVHSNPDRREGTPSFRNCECGCARGTIPFQRNLVRQRCDEFLVARVPVHRKSDPDW